MPLSDVIRARMAGSPIPFEAFMELALYHPDGGFFTSGTLRSEKGGDFLTSPEVSPLFGETIAVHVRREQERIGGPFRLIEVGAGSGSLLGPILGAIDVEAWAVEVSPVARSALGRLLPPSRVVAELPGRVRGVVIANELLDNLPMALAQRVGGEWRERWVGIDGDGFALVDAEPRPEVVEWLGAYAGAVEEGGWVEVQLQARSWIEEVLGRMEAGSVVVIDYGDTAENLLPRRRDGTLRTYRAHHLGPHPLDEPGATDITADVDFTPLVSTAERLGSEVRLLRQDEFLTELGLRERLADLRHAELEASRSRDDMERLRLRTLKTEAETLLHPRGLGDFRVLVCSL